MMPEMTQCAIKAPDDPADFWLVIRPDGVEEEFNSKAKATERKVSLDFELRRGTELADIENRA